MARKPEPDPSTATHGRRACGNCQHFERYCDSQQPPGEDILGECCLLPPKVHGYTEDDSPSQSRPRVAFRERCGQHQPQEH
jgi:hypothetical protein